MNHKIQEIIEREGTQLLGALDSLKPEYGCPDFNEYSRRREARMACVSARILRAVLEVIGEAGVEADWEIFDTPLPSGGVAWRKDGSVVMPQDLIAALRTIKELHQSSSGKNTQ